MQKEMSDYFRQRQLEKAFGGQKAPKKEKPEKPKKVYKIKQVSDKKRAKMKKGEPLIKRMGKKRAEAEKIYKKNSRAFRKLHPDCEIRSEVCTGKTQGVNHKKGKDTIELLLDEQFWEGSCNPCNLYIESNHEWGVKNGHKISKHEKSKQ